MFKKIEIWKVGLIVLFFILLIIFISGVLRDAYLGKNKTPEVLRNSFALVAEIPKNIYHVANVFVNQNLPPKLKKHIGKKRFNQLIPYKRNALLILPRYDLSLKRSLIDIIDLNEFEIIHTYKHNIDEMNNQVKNLEKFSRINIDFSPIRFQYKHPLLFDDGSLISVYGPAYKIDFCSNLEWINEKEDFHHSIELDHNGDIWIPSRMDPQSKYVKENTFRDYQDHSIVKINKKGELLFNKSVTEMLIENKVLDINIFNGVADPIHLNDIEPAFENSEYWKRGDLFLSIRNQSAIIHYRPDTNKVINYIIGPFAQQHDVDIISNKEISIFNNNNFIIDNQHSEIIIYNFETNKFKKLFNDQIKKENIKTKTQGLSHIFKDGALMVEENNHGRLILFNNQGEKEWEFVNKDKNGDIGRIQWSRIIEDDIFINNFKLLLENKKCIN